MDANGKGYTMALSFGGPCLETKYVEIKHKGNFNGDPHRQVINIWRLNLKEGTERILK
jgi:hypothetical protein